MFLDCRISIYCRFNNYFTLITKEKLHFSLIYSFYCCLVKEDWALKVAYQFEVWVLVAYKLVAYKKTSVINVGATTNYKFFFMINFD